MPARPSSPAVPARMRAAVARARRVLSREAGLAAAYVFGSALKRRDFEDVDIALLYSRGAVPVRRRFNRLALALDRAFRAETDLHLVNELPDPLRFRVVKDGVRFLTRDRLSAVRFEAGVLNVYLDFKPAADWLDGRILARAGPW